MFGFIAYIGRGVLIPLIVAGFLCFLIFTLKESFRRIPFMRWHLPNWLSFVFAFAFIGAGTMLVVEIIRANIEVLLETWPQYETRIISLSQTLVSWLQSLGILPDNLIGSVAQLQEAALNFARPALNQAASSVRALSANFATFASIFLYLVFLLIERGRIFKKIAMLGNTTGNRAQIEETISEIGRMIRQYITVKTLSNLVTATASYVIMKLIGVQFAGFWALLIFLLNYIPIFGAITGIMFPVLLALVQPQGGGVQTALIALVSMVAAEQVMSTLVEPRIVGRSLNLSPLVILFSLGVWGSLWGFAGLLLSVPITVSVMIVMTQFQSTRPIAIMLSDNGEIADIRHAPFNHSQKIGKQARRPRAHVPSRNQFGRASFRRN